MLMGAPEPITLSGIGGGIGDEILLMVDERAGDISRSFCEPVSATQNRST